MITIFECTAIALLMLMFPVLYRTAKGPTAVDRMVGVNIIGTKTMIILILIGAIYGELDMFVDLGLAYALLNFIASVAAAALLRGTRKTEPQLLHGSRFDGD